MGTITTLQRDFTLSLLFTLGNNEGRLTWSMGPQENIYNHEIAFTFIQVTLYFSLDSVIQGKFKMSLVLVLL